MGRREDGEKGCGLRRRKEVECPLLNLGRRLRQEKMIEDEGRICRGRGTYYRGEV